MKGIFFIVILVWSTCSSAQESFRFSLAPLDGAGISPVALPLEGMGLNTDNGRLALYDVNQPGKEIPSQLETGIHPKLWFMYDHENGPKEYLVRQLPGTMSDQDMVATVGQTEQVTSLNIDGLPVLNYHHADVFPPEGIDPVYRRSAFIHPLYSPGGAILTRIQPPDHYHHYGIWSPWTSTTINDTIKVDFWNLAQGQGRVQFGGYLGAEQGAVYSALKVRQEHVAYVGMPAGEELLALNEVWDVRVWNTGRDDVHIVDLTTTLNSPLNDGILLNAYRYGGGIGFRATELWGRDNSKVLTSEGKTRDDVDATRARWCMIEGETDVEEGSSGTIFLSHPSNRMHPEPMRMWPSNMVQGKGNIFFEFTPIRHKEWKIDPHQSYTLQYRIIVYDGQMTADEAEEYWKAFSKAPAIHIH